MKRLLVSVLFAMMLALALSQCGVKQEGKNDAPAGNPDELKDSSRLDAAPDTTRKPQQAPGPQ